MTTKIHSMQLDSPQKWKTLVILAICQALHFHRSYSPKIPTIFLSTSIFHVYRCLEKCWKTRKLKIPSSDKKKKIIDQINKHISKKARILHIYLSISRDIIFDEKNICSILFNTLSSKCINCSSTTLNKMKLYFYLINESFWKLSQESPIDFWDTLYMYIKWSRYFYFTRCGIYVGKIYVKISCGCCGICESVSTVAYSGINNVGGGDRRLRDMQISTSAHSNRCLLISPRVANRRIQLTRYHKGYT